MDAIGQNLGLLVFGDFANAFCYCAVGEEHELFDEFVGVFCYFASEVDGMGLDITAGVHYTHRLFHAGLSVMHLTAPTIDHQRFFCEEYVEDKKQNTN